MQVFGKAIGVLNKLAAHNGGTKNFILNIMRQKFGNQFVDETINEVKQGTKKAEKECTCYDQQPHKLKLCSECKFFNKNTYYCNRNHQKKYWKFKHGNECECLKQ